MTHTMITVTITDPTNGQELMFTGSTDDEIDRQIDDHFGVDDTSYIAANRAISAQGQHNAGQCL
ncbi:hypothetical protein [Gordonia alkanivorans]|uniref:hypothetical protein n=1 Tax=Gordonia alkanivorans TaxID=84096 RepID=UPI0004AD6BEA|nr:hypothetical protein [Gordonia alkanivorans]